MKVYNQTVQKKIPLDYIFSNTLAAIYKISLNDELYQKPLGSDYFKTEDTLNLYFIHKLKYIQVRFYLICFNAKIINIIFL